jgi:NitT/TauT family transport system substrate-binding protein
MVTRRRIDWDWRQTGAGARGGEMGKFRIHSHGRLQEWVAEEQGYFKDEGLDYDFLVRPLDLGTFHPDAGSVQSTDSAPVNVTRGAFETYEDGRECEISSACHWATNMAASAGRGWMYGKAYSVTPSGIYVPPESPIRTPADLAGVEIAVGYHSGSHFSTLQGLSEVLPADQVKLRFGGFPLDRLRMALAREVPAAALFGCPLYVVEQQGFRKVLDTTFMIGYMISAEADREDVERYFRALLRAQRDIDLEPERYKHYFLKELPKQYHALVDVRGFGTGERVVGEAYTAEMFEKTHRWMEELKIFPEAQSGSAGYRESILV